MDQGKLYEKQISLFEWLEDIGFKNTEAFRLEDYEKRERLKIIKEICGIPFDEPHKFEALDVVNRSPAVVEYVEAHGDELCALRIIPKTAELKKLRVRGKTVRDSLVWLDGQDFDASQCRAEFLPHSDQYTWSTIFIVTDKGIFGEIIRGAHAQLTQGVYDNAEPVQFSYDFTKWSFSEHDSEAQKAAKEFVDKVKISSAEQKQQLKETLHSEFAHDYLKGYFETIISEQFGFWLVDYNRVLGEMFHTAELPTFSIEVATQNTLKGQVGNKGTARGIVRIVSEDRIASAEFHDGDILVCTMTMPAYLPLIKKAAAVVTAQGGILSHAAIACRELGVPCIVGARGATTMLQTGDTVLVDADKGTIIKS